MTFAVKRTSVFNAEICNLNYVQLFLLFTLREHANKMNIELTHTKSRVDSFQFYRHITINVSIESIKVDITC